MTDQHPWTGTRRGRAGPALTVALSVVLAACASTEMERYVEQGRYEEAVAAFEADPGLETKERVLYLAGVAYSVPGSEARDVESGRRVLEQLLETFPDTKYRGEVIGLLSFLDRERELGNRIARVSATLEALKAVDVGPGTGASPGDASDFNRLFEGEEYAMATRMFEGEPSLHSDEHTLFRAAVAYSLPRGGAYDPQRARELFQQLTRLYPESAYRDDAAWFSELLELQVDLSERVRELEREIERGAGTAGPSH